MVTTIGELLLEFVKAVFDIRGKFSSAEKDKRDRLVNFFDHIADTLDKIADEFITYNSPRGLVGEIQYYVQNFHEITKNIINDKRVNMLYKQLTEACTYDYKITAILKMRQERTKGPDSFILDISELSSYFGYLNNKKLITETELNQMIDEEINNIRESAGLFRAVAMELRTKV